MNPLTIIPVAGIGEMSYGRFALYNVAGGLLWVISLTGGGYLFGNIPIVKNNFELVVRGIIAVSLLPIVFELLRAYGKREAAA